MDDDQGGLEDADAKSAMDLVEAAIRELGVDPASSRSVRPGNVSYALRRGSARILIGVHDASGELPEGRLRVVAPMIRLPEAANQPPLMRWLLEANASHLVGAAFAISGEDVIVVAERSVKDLDASEVRSAVRNVGRVADLYDDQLAETFEVKRSSDA